MYETGTVAARFADVIDLFDRCRRNAEWLDDITEVDVA